MPTPRRFLPGSNSEWTGVFLFGVGLFGCLQGTVMRHLTLFGWLPLDWFYLGLLAVGGAMLLSVHEEGPRSWQARAAYAFRVVAALGLVAYMVFKAVVVR